MDAENDNSLNDIPAGEPQNDLTLQRMRAETLGTSRTEVTILFSDIQGSTSYFERKGDAQGLAMVQHHNTLLFPVIENGGGRVVKTIGDAIMACFKDPAAAIKAAIKMQQVLQEDRSKTQSEDDRIHIRVALHMGPGLEKDNDVFGDVVNATAKVQQQADPDQILITDVLLDAARQSGAQCAKLGRAQIKGKDEAIEVYAVAWSETTGQQLIEGIQKQLEAKLRELRRQKEELEEELDSARDQWRTERRRLNTEIEELEAEVEKVRETATQGVSSDLQAQVKFQLEEALRAKQQAEQELIDGQARWEIERGRLRNQIDALQANALQAMEQSHNPTRFALAVREQVEVRMKESRRDWEQQWDIERRRLNEEIQQLKKSPGYVDDRKDAARRAVLQKLGKVPTETGTTTKSADTLQREMASAKSKWDAERDELLLQIKKLERQVHQNTDAIRQEVFQELRSQYEPKLGAYESERRRLREDLESANAQLAEERQRLNDRVQHLEQLIPEAQEAVRAQVTAELEADFENKMEELSRIKSRNERRANEALEDAEVALRRANKEIARLQEELKEAREVAFRAQRGIRSSALPTTS
jgi:class 3 adenylate cyclase